MATTETREQKIARLLAKDQEREEAKAKRAKERAEKKAKIESGELQEEPNTEHQMASDVVAYITALHDSGAKADPWPWLDKLVDFLDGYSMLDNLTSSTDYRPTQGFIKRAQSRFPVAVASTPATDGGQPNTDGQ